MLALWDNTGGAIFAMDRLKPFGFLIFLAALGYVVAKRNLDSDAQLMAVQKELEVAGLDCSSPMSPDMECLPR